jgi:hypothetical protein
MFSWAHENQGKRRWVRTEMGGAGAPRSAEEGADTAVWLAADAPPELTGKFFRDRQEISW